MPGIYNEAPIEQLHPGHLLFKRISGKRGYFLSHPNKENIFRLYLLQVEQFLLVVINMVSIFHSLHLGSRR